MVCVIDMAMDVTWITNMTDVSGLIAAPNHVTGNLWGVLIWAAAFVIIFFVSVGSRELRNSDNAAAESLFITGFMMSIISVFFNIIGILQGTAQYLIAAPILLMMVAIIVIARNR